jgi:hypothetical protein
LLLFIFLMTTILIGERRKLTVVSFACSSCVY